MWDCCVGLAVALPLYIHAASINIATALVAPVVTIVVAAAVATAVADIIAAVSLCMIVSAAQGNVHSCHDSGLQPITMDAAIVINLCNFELYLL